MLPLRQVLHTWPSAAYTAAFSVSQTPFPTATKRLILIDAREKKSTETGGDGKREKGTQKKWKSGKKWRRVRERGVVKANTECEEKIG